MQVSKDKVVTLDYTLTDDEGEVLDSSVGEEPLAYLHGAGNIIPGLENALEGKSVGDQFQTIISPVDGYGERDEELVQPVPRSKFSGMDDLEVGMQFQARTEGGVQIFTVVEIDEQTVTVDGNHSLAGQTLHFDVKVMGVRDATAEEIHHGHVHGPGGHHH